MRRSNLSTVLTGLHKGGPVTRTELTALIGLSRSTVGELVNELPARGLVTEVASKSRGVPGLAIASIQFIPDGACVLAVVRTSSRGHTGITNAVDLRVARLPDRTDTAGLIYAGEPTSVGCWPSTGPTM